MQSEGEVTPKMGSEVGAVSSKMMSSENLSSKSMIFRADKIDLKKLDVRLEKHFSRIFSKSIEAKRPKEAWEIDLAKLDLQYSIANGAYGYVYRGTYDTQDVAVKFLDWGEDGAATTAEIAALRASFWQEVTLWQKLDHPNVTKVQTYSFHNLFSCIYIHDYYLANSACSMLSFTLLSLFLLKVVKFVGASMSTSNLEIPLPTCGQNSTPSKACCLIAEFLPGGTLKQYLFKNRRNKLPYKDVIQLALDLSRGLSYLHAKQIVHRDIKSENMLLDANQNLKIADFGVSRVEATNQSEMTGETGTYGYMAPEVLNGKSYNRKCDVYSFGICLWEIYCCNMPYSKLSLAAVSCAVINQHLRPEIPRRCPSALANIMRKCWDAKPERRPEMHEVVKMLEAIDISKGSGMKHKDHSPFFS
ncbi:Serine/threonine-protein kinase STY17, partial [Mucuna pruriens]